MRQRRDNASGPPPAGEMVKILTIFATNSQAVKMATIVAIFEADSRAGKMPKIFVIFETGKSITWTAIQQHDPDPIRS